MALIRHDKCGVTFDLDPVAIEGQSAIFCQVCRMHEEPHHFASDEPDVQDSLASTHPQARAKKAKAKVEK